MNNWIYQDKEFTTPDKDMVGFVYIIEEKDTGKKYIGKKLFFKYVKRKVKRGGKAMKRVQRESDWQKYHGSSKDLQERLASSGPDNYIRTILHICKSKSMMSYLELKEQIDQNVLFDDSFYNNFIGTRINGNHLKE